MIEIEGRLFNKTQTSKYLFIKVKGKAVCLVRREKIKVFKIVYRYSPNIYAFTHIHVYTYTHIYIFIQRGT